MKKYEKGCVVHFTGDVRKHRSVIFGVVTEAAELYIEVDFYEEFQRCIRFNIDIDNSLISPASTKEVERFIAERKEILYSKIAAAKKSYKDEMKFISKQYPNMKEFINSIKKELI